nr:neither inactivation nor afterpotential protein C-like isoform X2 [Procambarus clarkii]
MAYESLSKYLDFHNTPEPGDRFTLQTVIAAGTYAEVYQATDAENYEKSVAVKIIENIKENIEEIEEEYRVLSELSHHDNFPQFFGIFLKRAPKLEEHQIWFVMELVSHGTVSELARAYTMAGERMPEPLIAYILKQVILAVCHLHQAHVMHRDVKGLNVLITDQGNIKLVDFGQCGHLDATMDKRGTSVGTPYWMAPEVIECEQKTDQDYDNRCDVWSLGITAIELADGDPPYADIHPVRAIFQVVRNPPPTLKRSSHWSQEFIDFISECLVKNPDHRPVMLELLEHPFISGVPHPASQVKKLLVEEKQRLLDSDLRPGRPTTAIARQGYLKSDRLSKPKKMVTDDLASLEFFNEDVVLDCLFSRWSEGHVYTWVADVLLAVNPFAHTCKYDEEVQAKYKSKSRSQNDPHIFAMADRAHQDMMHHKEHQTIVLTGESGSGKTFNFHQLIKQFSYIGFSNPGLIDKMEKVCTVLEAFGNAVTQLNPNSTRHTRYFDITFSKTGKISGVIVWLLMLDKFRVTERPRDEGNFHIFYYMYDGFSQTSRLSRYGLKVGRKYSYLAKHPYDNEVTNARKFAIIEQALEVIGFRERESHTIFLVLAAILILGNVEFTGNQQAAIVDLEPVDEVCRLLDIEEKKLSWALCNHCRVKPDQSVESVRKTQHEAEHGRDSLARTLYCRVVDFLVNAINSKLSVTRLVFGDPYAIGILDMFGFESNDHNSLENLLVNVVNEQIQYYYNQYVFNWEMQDYEEEGIPVKTFTFPDNRHILELFLAKSSGIFAILEDESRDPSGSDTSLSCKLEQRCIQKQMQRVSEFTYAISHYVGRVKYDARGFLRKNRDHVSIEVVQTLRQSANEYIRGMFCNKLTKTGNVTLENLDSQTKDKAPAVLSKKKDSRRFNTKSKGRLSQTKHTQTLGTNLRYALIELLYKLTNSQPHFLRCIRSNMDNSESIFDRDMIKHQIKYHAVCDTIRIRQQGFSHRISYREFLRRYQFLAFDYGECVDVTKDNARLLLVRLKMEGWAIGKDKVFLKYYNEEFLSRLYESSVKKIIKIQAAIRSYMLRKHRKAEEVIEPKESTHQAKVHLENAEIANRIKERTRFGEGTIQAEAARYVQFYFRKWKMRTLFQQLQVYRAAKQQQLVYFSQQVHLYGQETQARLQRVNIPLDLSKVRNEGRNAHKTILARVKVPQPKLALDHMLNAYFDTTFLCDPSRSKKGRQQDDDWEAPFKIHTSPVQSDVQVDQSPSVMVQHTPPVDTTSAPTHAHVQALQAKKGGDESRNNAPVPVPAPVPSYNRFAGSSSYRPTPNYNQFVGSNPVIKPRQVNQYSGSYLKPATPRTPTAVVINTWDERQHNGYSNNVEQEDQGTHDFRKHLRKTNHSAIQEMEARASALGGGDDGTFNFQGILRKTEYNRDSLTREKEDDFDYPNGDQRPVSTTPNNERSFSPTFIEETDEAML